MKRVRKRLSAQTPTAVWQALRFAVKGAGGLAANIALLTLFVDYLGVPPELAIFPSAAILMVVGYVVVDRWVFREEESPEGLRANAKRSVSFWLVQWGGKAVNYGIYVALLSYGVAYQLAWVIGAVAVFAVTFTANRWLWTRRSDSQTEA